jgi:hypothetical protein
MIARILFLLLLASAQALYGETRVTTTTPFQGVTLHQRLQTSPRALKINIVEIDLKSPGIRFRVTPSNGDLPGETTAQTTRDFMIEQHAQLAINATFYKSVKWPYLDSHGLVASDGVVYSEPADYPAINISRNNVAEILPPAKQTSAEPYNAVAGNAVILRRGRNVAKDKELHPRTAIGIATNSRLVILVVDGRQELISEGMTTIEVADVLKEYGVTDALNLDGGGSTTLAIADPSPRVVNTPMGTGKVRGSQRKNAVNLAVFARPQSPPLPRIRGRGPG